MTENTNWTSMSDRTLAAHIGAFVRHHRLQQNRTQGTLAYAAGISRSTLSLLERGQPVTLTTLIQALDRTQPMLPDRPGQIEHRTHDYKRNGTRSLYAAFDILTCQVMGRVTRKHRAKECLAFLRQVTCNTPKNRELHLSLDNSATHDTEKVRTWFVAYPRSKLHFTPTSASWLNAAASWFSQLERRALYQGAFNHF